MVHELEQAIDIKDISDARRRMSFIEYMADKSSRLLKVAYLVTNNIDLKDPIRNRIREVSFLLRDKSHYLKDIPHSFDTRELEEVSHAAEALDEYVGLLAAAGHLSAANSAFLSGEYRTLVRVCREFLGTQSFAFPAQGLLEAGPQAAAPVRRDAGRAQVAQKAPFARPADPGISDRRARILARIVPGGDYSIRHILEGVPGVSEKTIQRELLAMVSEGILVKKGERRWSTYSRAK